MGIGLQGGVPCTFETLGDRERLLFRFHKIDQVDYHCKQIFKVQQDTVVRKMFRRIISHV